jgi:hypothetical protein
LTIWRQEPAFATAAATLHRIAGICEDALEGKRRRVRWTGQGAPVAICALAEWTTAFSGEAERVNEDMPLAARDLLARHSPAALRPSTMDNIDSPTQQLPDRSKAGTK